MFCSHCGNVNDDKANFCRNCGSSLSSGKSPAATDLSPATVNQRPLSFREYMEKNGATSSSDTNIGEKANNETSTFKNIKKRKKNERLGQIKKNKKDEFVKVKLILKNVCQPSCFALLLFIPLYLGN